MMHSLIKRCQSQRNQLQYHSDDYNFRQKSKSKSLLGVWRHGVLACGQ